MQKLIQIIRSINLKQVLTVFLAGCLLTLSTACSQDNVAQAGGKAYTETAKRAMSDTYDDYDANQGFKGGMNGYNDDRRYDSETATKAKTLVDTAKRRQADNLGEFTDNVKEVFDEATDTAQNALDDAAKATKKTTKNIKGNFEDLT